MNRILTSGVGLATTVLLVGACGGTGKPATNYSRAAANVAASPTNMETSPEMSPTATSTATSTATTTGTASPTASPTGTESMMSPMPTPQHAMVKVAESSKYGKILVGENDRPLYMFDKDKDGMSNCDDECATTWPPLLTRDKPKAGTGVKEDMLGTITRKQGDKQVTYNKIPLYYYSGDKNTGEYNGQNKSEFGGKWYLVSPDGKRVEK